VVAGAVSHGDVNVSVTVHNLSVWLSALCHAIGVVLHEPRRTLRHGGWWLLAMFHVRTHRHYDARRCGDHRLDPDVLHSRAGRDTVRQVVLGSAVAMFVFSALVLRAKDRGESSPFARWYYLGLLLMATGLIGVLIQTAHSSVLGWMGMATQWLSGSYLVIAALAAARESNAWEISLAATPNDVRLRYCMAALLVIAAAIVQLVAVPESGARIVYRDVLPGGHAGRSLRRAGAGHPRGRALDDHHRCVLDRAHWTIRRAGRGRQGRCDVLPGKLRRGRLDDRRHAEGSGAGRVRGGRASPRR
jgi:hypothetical protein